MFVLAVEGKKTVRNAAKHWICWKVKDFLIQESTLGARALQKKLKEHHKVSIPYHRVYKGQQLALKRLYGDWDSSFDNLFSLKAEIERPCPGSSVIIDHYTVNGKIRFTRFFFAMKPCIDGFLNGCRPYLAIDSTFLTGKFKGQLASASAVPDTHIYAKHHQSSMAYTQMLHVHHNCRYLLPGLCLLNTEPLSCSNNKPWPRTLRDTGR